MILLVSHGHTLPEPSRYIPVPTRFDRSPQIYRRHQGRRAIRCCLCSCSIFWYVYSLYHILFCFGIVLSDLLPTRFIVGGIKLGAGGLIRAYGGAARLVLREAPKEVLIPKTSLRVCVPSQNAGAVYDAAAKVGGSASNEEYKAEGELVVTVTCELEQGDRLRQILSDATRGNAEFLELEDNVDS